MKSDLEAVIADSDVLLLGLNDKNIFQTLTRCARKEQLLLDLVGMPRADDLRCDYAGVCW